MKKLFNPKKTISSVSSSKLNIKLIIYLSIVIFLVTIVTFIGFGEEYKKTIIETTQNYQNNEKIQVYEGMVMGAIIAQFFLTIFILLFLTAINWVIKFLLSHSGKKITLYKLLNISIYSFLANRLIALIILLIFIIACKIFSGLNYNNVSPVLSVLSLVNFIFGLCLYIYGIKISIKKMS